MTKTTDDGAPRVPVTDDGTMRDRLRVAVSEFLSTNEAAAPHGHAVLLRAIKAELVGIGRSATRAGAPARVLGNLYEARRQLEDAALSIEDHVLLRREGES